MRHRHVLVALLIGPLLGIMAWYFVGALFGEKAERARAGQSYPLLASSNCRYASGRCDLRNNDLLLSLQFENSATPVLQLIASHHLDTILIAVGGSRDETAPRAMLRNDDQRHSWRLQLRHRPQPGELLRLAAQAGGSSYFAETELTFAQTERLQ